MSAAEYEIRSEPSGGHWVAWVVRTPDGKPDKSVRIVGRNKEEAEARARAWADGKVR